GPHPDLPTLRHHPVESEFHFMLLILCRPFRAGTLFCCDPGAACSASLRTCRRLPSVAPAALLHASAGDVAQRFHATEFSRVLRTSGKTSRPKVSTVSTSGQPEMMNSVTPMRSYSSNASAISRGVPSKVVQTGP